MIVGIKSLINQRLLSLLSVCVCVCRLTGAGPSLWNQPGLSQPCLSWKTQPCSVSTCSRQDDKDEDKSAAAAPPSRISTSSPARNERKLRPSRLPPAATFAKLHKCFYLCSFKYLNPFVMSQRAEKHLSLVSDYAPRPGLAPCGRSNKASVPARGCKQRANCVFFLLLYQGFF